MSSYWKKKMEELEQEKKAPSLSYWEKKTAELEDEKKTVVNVRSKKDDDDIAPIKSTKDDGKLDFFQKGAFEDGYQVGDITKTILGTVGDAGLNAVKGAASLGEGLGDLINYGIAGAADAIGKDDFADRLRKNAKENAIDKLMKPAEDYLDRSSILGRTSDSILQGVGQVGGIMATGGLGAAAGLGAGGVTALTTGVMGLSGMGSGMSEAYQSGATDGEATLYGAISGTADAISELIFGGLGKAVNAVGFSRGLSSADDMLAKKVSSMFSNQIMKNFSEFGIKAGAEGLEEVLAGIAQAAGKKATYMSEEEWGKILKDENLLEQFVVGAVTSGIAQTPGLHIANKTGTDFITGLNQNEQAVVKKEIENRIAEAEADGKKLTAREKAAIEAQVEKDLEKGYISTDLIDEVVGGETYKAYKDSVDQEDAIFKEYEELGKATNPTLAQQYRYRELDSRVKSIKDNDLRSRRKEHLDQFVAEQVNGSRLAESYNERVRRGQAFEADLSKYDVKQQAVIQKAAQSGILNNTNRTHEFVDMIAKISADKGVLFDFTNNEKLKESGFAVDGKAVNGYVTKDGITLNVQSSKALNSIVGHEITHVLEGTDLYTELQNAVVEYAKTKGDYQGRFDSLSKLYEAVEGADINAEITADLVGDYLFTDQDFINNLSVNNRNVFQKIYDEVKYLLKVATAGSKEARELEKVKRAFEKAYREGETARESEEISDSKTKYSIREEAPPKNTGVAYKVFFVKDGKLYPPMVANPGGADTPMGVWLNADMGTAAPPSKTGRAQVKAGGKGTQGGGGSLAFRPGWHLGDLPRASQFDRVNPETGKKELFPENFVWAEVEYAKDVDYQEEAMSYGYTDKGKFRHAYAGLPRLPENGYYRYRTNPKPDTVPWVITGAMKVNRLLSDAEVNAILEKNGVPPVHRQGGDVGLDKFGFNDDGTVKYSLSAEQQEFFKDSVVRDENGNLKVMYHGTSKGGFTVFDTYKSKYGLFGTGFYFTDSENIGESYTKKGKGNNPQVYEAYLNIKNPLDMDAQANPDEWSKAFDEVDFPESGTNEDFYRALEEYYEDQQIAKWEVEDIIRESIEYGMGYDGITHIGGGRVNPDGERHRVYIAFEPEQIKNVDNRKPTSDPDIRYSLSEDSDGNKLTEEQAEYFKKSKMRDDNGNLKPMYHGTKYGGFHVFDPDYSDDGTSFFFVDSNDVASSYSGTSETYEARSFKTADDFNKFFAEIGATEYSVKEENHEGYKWFQLYEDGTEIASRETAKMLYEEFRDWSGLGYGDVNYKVYLNLENPLEVDARGSEWSDIQIPKEHLAKFNETVYQTPDPYGYLSTANTRSFAEYAKGQGYDGVIFKNILDVGGYGGKYDPHTVAIAFDSNQVKSVANTQPTSAADIRYSLSDSEGTRLTEDQQEYFAESKARDENGNLYALYHGSRSPLFTEFDMYEGVWLTPDQRYAEVYAEQWHSWRGDSEDLTGLEESVYADPDYRLYKMYANIKNPLDLGEINGEFDRRQMNRLARLLGVPTSRIKDISHYDGEQTVAYVYEVTKDHKFIEMAKEKGYDGFTATEAGKKTFCAFDAPNQVKLTTNEVPSGFHDIRYSLSHDTEYMDKAIAKNESMLYVNKDVMTAAKATREKIASRMNDIKDRGLVALPDDLEGDTAISNSSYDITEENTTICPRSLAAEAFVDAVSEYLGRPLTVDEQIYISQDLQGRSLTPECTYCYVATDRKAYRAFLGNYISQRDAVLRKVQANPDADVSRSGALYEEFRNGRKDTNPMYNRFKMWVDAYKNGKPMVEASHLANISKLMGDINSEFGAELKPQIVDAMKYAQSASWAKKRVSYVAYDGHILKWKQDRINKLNSHYGLRMYSFSDFHPAFVLENMQMITDASVRGLKMLGYTKDTDFVEIFAPSGMNINISTFGFETGGNVYENNIIGAEWEKAKALREQYPNVGITFVATNDHLVNWALEQDWIDVVIPYHLVRTGAEVAKAFGYTNYTSESSDTKTKAWAKGDKKYIAPTEHNNDKATYLAALEKNHLKPRFERFIENPNYMKLVNECRQPASQSKPVQPVFNEDAAMVALAKLEANGYYQPIGGSVERMYEIAAEVAEDMTKQLAPAMSLSEDGAVPKTYGRYNVYGKDIALSDALFQEEVAPVGVKNTPTVSEMESVAPVAISNTETTTEESSVAEMFPDDLAPIPEEDAAAFEEERLSTLSEDDMPPEVDAPYPDDNPVPPGNPFDERDMKEVGKRNINAYMFENPEVKPFFQSEANIMLGELKRTVKGERIYNEEGGWTGTSRYTSDDIAYLRDEYGYTYAEIEKGLNAIIQDNGKENNAVSKRIEFILNDRLLKGYREFETEMDIPADQDYINLVNEKRISEYSEEAFARFMETADEYAPPAEEDIAPVVKKADKAYEAIRPRPPKKVKPADDDIAPVYGDKLVRVDSSNGRPGEKQRKWVGTSTESEAVNRQVLPDDLDQDKIHYQPISNKVTLNKANAKLDGMGYESSVTYFNNQFTNKSVSLEDVALGERLIQEAIKRGDTKTAGELIQNVAILGTELGQKVQALSMIQRMTPEGQLKMLRKTVERGKAKGDKAYDGVEFTQEMIDRILKEYGKDGSYDQERLTKAVEDVKKQIADQMKVTALDKVNAWRYLSMLGNPKTHIRNLVSNVAMRGTVAVKDALARTIETAAPIQNRTKTWEKPTEFVTSYAQKTAAEMKDILTDGGKYSEDASIKQKRDIFKNRILNGLYEFNSDMLTKEDWWFSKTAFTKALSEYLTANGIRTKEDMEKHPKIVEKAKVYATEQSQIATFRQYSWLANKINDIERHNAATNIAVGAIMPFKKTPINIAKTGLNYSPLGFAKTLTSDVSKVKKGDMEASELIDHLSQNITGSALTLVGYMLASSGFLSGAGEDDKEGEYDYQLGEQAYAINIGGKSYSLSWLSPIAMPLFVGANAYEQLVEGKEWNGDVVVETLAQTLDPLSEMSFLSGLDSVLSSYDSGIQKFAGIAQTMAQNYATQFVPTFSSQVAQVLDDTKRSTKVGADSDFKFVDQTINKLKYKIPFLRETLEPTTDIWGNNVKQTENFIARAVETFLAPYAAKGSTATAVDEEIKALYRETGEDSIIPGIPNSSVTYKDQKYEMSAEEYTAFKQTYGQTAFGLLEELFRTGTYQNADASEKADMIDKVYDYARDVAKQEFLAGHGVEYTNATSEGEGIYKDDAILGAIRADMPVDEYKFFEKDPEKYALLEQIGITYDTYRNADDDAKKAYNWALENPDKYPMSKAVASDVVEYRRYASELYDIKADKDDSGKSISGSRKEKVLDYINGLDIDYGAKLILFKSEYNADDESNYEIIDYLNSRSDISYEEEVTILRELGFTVTDDGTIYWD